MVNICGEIPTSVAVPFMKYCAFIERKMSLLSCGIHPFHCWDFIARVLFVSSQTFLMAFTHWQTISHEEACVPKPSFNGLQHSNTLLPNKTWYFVNVLASIHEKLLCSLSQSIAKQQLMSRGQCIFKIAITPHMT